MKALVEEAVMPELPEVEQPIRCADGTDARDADDLRLALSRYDDGVGEDGHL